MFSRRLERINSLLREVISEVIMREVKNPHFTSLVSVTDVETSRDLHHAKVFVSIIGSPEEKKKAMEILHQARGYIAVMASKKVVIRFFPELHFKLDEGASNQARIEELLRGIKKEKEDGKSTL